MQKLIAIAVVAAFGASAALAQATQQGELGDSGNPDYPLLVAGSNGVTYACKAEIETIDGVAARKCIRDDDDGAGVFAAGDGLATGVAAGGAAIVLVAVAASSDGDSPTTTTGSDS